MKRILTILFLFAFVQSYAQKTQQSLGTKNTMIVALSDFKVDSLLFLPERDTTFTPFKNGAVILKQSDSSLYYWAKYWRPMGGAFVKSVYKRGDSLFYQRSGAEYFVAKWGNRAFTVPTGLTATQIGDSVSITTALNGLIIGNGTGFSTATVDAPLYFSNGRLRISKAGLDSSGYLSAADWQAFNAKISPSRQVATSGSITGGGALTQDRTLTLVGDNLNPGPWKYYGTNGVSTKGFFDLPGYVDSVQSVFGRTGHIAAQESDYENFYALRTHSHLGLMPIGGMTGQVLKKLSNNDYDVVWENDNNNGGSGSSGTGVDTLARMGDTLMFRKNLVDYFIPDAFKRRLYAPGNGISITQDSIIALKYITVTSDSNILIGTAVNDGHKLKVKGSVRLDVGSDAQGDTYYRDGFGSLTRLPKPTGITNPVLSFDPYTIKPYWKQVDGADSSIFATKYWAGTQYVPLAGYNKTNWDAAYSWGNHASAGYLTNITGKVQPGANITITGSGTTAAPYVVNASALDTTSLSNRIDGKLNITDTSTKIATRYWVEQKGYGTGNGSGRDSSAIQYFSQLNDSTFLGNRLKGAPDTVLISFNQGAAADTANRYILNNNSFTQNAGYKISGTATAGVLQAMGTGDYSFIHMGLGDLVKAQLITNTSGAVYLDAPSGFWVRNALNGGTTICTISNSGIAAPSFTGDAVTTRGFLLLTPKSTAPASPVNGVVYYDSLTNQFAGYRNGSYKNFLMQGDVSGLADAQTLSLNTDKSQLSISNGNTINFPWTHYTTQTFETTVGDGTTPVVKYTISNVPNDAAYLYWVTVRMSCTDASSNVYSCEKKALAKVVSGSTTIVRVVETVAKAATGALVNADFTIVSNSNKPAVQVTGVGYSGVFWKAVIIVE